MHACLPTHLPAQRESRMTRILLLPRRALRSLFRPPICNYLVRRRAINVSSTCATYGQCEAESNVTIQRRKWPIVTDGLPLRQTPKPCIPYWRKLDQRRSQWAASCCAHVRKVLPPSIKRSMFFAAGPPVLLKSAPQLVQSQGWPSGGRKFVRPPAACDAESKARAASSSVLNNPMCLRPSFARNLFVA